MSAVQQLLAGYGASSPPGDTWSQRDSSRAWRCVACSSTGQYAIAGVLNSTAGVASLYRSTDYGAIWSETSLTGVPIVAVASSADGAKLIAGDGTGYAYVSTDSGTNWNPVNTSYSAVRDVAISDDGATIAVVYEQYVFVSRDSGSSWSQVTTLSLTAYGVAMTGSGVTIVLSGTNNQMAVSSNYGVSWTRRDIPYTYVGGSTSTHLAISGDGTRWLVFWTNSEAYAFKTADSGATWSAESSLPYFCREPAMSSDGTVQIAPVSNDKIYLSQNSGAAWSGKDSARNWWGSAISADGSKMFAVAYNGYIYTSG